MGGHGGLNILPQKLWNVYRFDNREKVRQDEEAHAKKLAEEKEQKQKEEGEARRLLLLENSRKRKSDQGLTESAPVASSEHINLFEGLIKVADVKDNALSKNKDADSKKQKDGESKKDNKKKTVTPQPGPEDEVYRLGYGLIGKGAAKPWYLEKKRKNRTIPSFATSQAASAEPAKPEKKRKTVEELRQERSDREQRERQREQDLVDAQSRRDGCFKVPRAPKFHSGFGYGK